MLHFAKLFDFGPRGQLLVQRVNLDEDEQDSAPFQLVLKTRNGQGVQVELTPGYFDEAERDRFFDRFDKKMAEGQMQILQNMLASATS